MNNYGDLYQFFLKADEERKRTNFNAFMNGFESGLVEDLNKAYKESPAKYEKLLKNVKSKGIRIFRDNNGRHKLQFI